MGGVGGWLQLKSHMESDSGIDQTERYTCSKCTQIDFRFVSLRSCVNPQPNQNSWARLFFFSSLLFSRFHSLLLFSGKSELIGPVSSPGFTSLSLPPWSGDHLGSQLDAERWHPALLQSPRGAGGHLPGRRRPRGQGAGAGRTGAPCTGAPDRPCRLPGESRAAPMDPVR